MDAWEGWDFQRFYLLFVGAAFVLLGVQVFLFHWRAAFSKRSMYLPVLAAPLLALAAIVAAITREGAIGWIALAVFAVGVAGGVFGAYEHLRGIAGRIGGFASEQGLTAGHFTAIGAFSDVTLGFLDQDTKEYEPIVIGEQVEALSLVGDVSLEEGEPRIHAHVVVGKRDGRAYGGHLLEAHVWPTLEVVLTESPAHLRREVDRETGLPLIALPKQD